MTKLERNSWNMPGWGDLMKKFKLLKQDVTISDFLDEYFSEAKYEQRGRGFALYRRVRYCRSGKSQRILPWCDEWGNEDDDAQYRIAGGYGNGWITRPMRAGCMARSTTSIRL